MVKLEVTGLYIVFLIFFLSETLVGAVLTCADNQCFEQKQKKKYIIFSAENLKCLKLSQNMCSWACFPNRICNFYVRCWERSTNGNERLKVAYKTLQNVAFQFSILYITVGPISALVKKVFK